MPPVHTVLLTARLAHAPKLADQRELNRVLDALAASYAFGAAQLITHVAYGLSHSGGYPAASAAISRLAICRGCSPTPTGSRSRRRCPALPRYTRTTRHPQAAVHAPGTDRTGRDPVHAAQRPHFDHPRRAGVVQRQRHAGRPRWRRHTRVRRPAEPSRPAGTGSCRRSARQVAEQNELHTSGSSSRTRRCGWAATPTSRANASGPPAI
jgi:hypothetical protein